MNVPGGKREKGISGERNSMGESNYIVKDRVLRERCEIWNLKKPSIKVRGYWVKSYTWIQLKNVVCVYSRHFSFILRYRKYLIKIEVKFKGSLFRKSYRNLNVLFISHCQHFLILLLPCVSFHYPLLVDSCFHSCNFLICF